MKDLLWMQTAGGRKFYPSAPLSDAINIEDIAHALSMICRFGGHCSEFYSVAQHSVLVTDFVTAHLHPSSLSDIRWALLHDAAEAYIGDMVWPLKQDTRMAGYRTIENKVERAIAAKFGLEGEMPSIVKHADLVLLATEKRDLMSDGPGKEDGADREAHSAKSRLGAWHCDRVEPWARKIESWDPATAKKIFLHRFWLHFETYR
jgi:5'-nucleotidase